MVVSAGDLIGASPLISGLFLDEPTIEVMNAIGIDLNAVGNHEFDRGAGELCAWRRAGAGPMRRPTASAAPRPREATPAHAFPSSPPTSWTATARPLFAPSVVREFDGIRIGFIGAVTRSTPGIVQPDGVAGLRFGVGGTGDQSRAPALQAQGVQAIVAVIHEGGEADGGLNECDNPRGAIFDIERELDRSIDVVLSAHTHRGYQLPHQRTRRHPGRVVRPAGLGRRPHDRPRKR